MQSGSLDDQLRDIKGRFNEYLGYCVDNVVSARDRAVTQLRDFYDELDSIRRDLFDLQGARTALDESGRAVPAARINAEFDDQERRLRARRDDLDRERVRLERMVSGCTSMMNRLRLAGEVVNSNVDTVSSMSFIEGSADAILGVQFAEGENRRLAREIHDGPVQQFSAVMLMFDYLDRVADTGDMDAVRAETQRIRGELKRALDDFRSFLRYLQPTGLEVGLGRAIRRFAESASERFGVEFDLDFSSDEDDLSMVKRINIFRVVQEAISNAARHGGASRISIGCWIDERGVHLNIKDDGSGFEVDRGRMLAAERGSFGISNMSERVRSMNGSLNLTSEPGHGTEISMIVPCDEESPRQFGR